MRTVPNRAQPCPGHGAPDRAPCPLRSRARARARSGTSEEPVWRGTVPADHSINRERNPLSDRFQGDTSSTSSDLVQTSSGQDEPTSHQGENTDA